MDAGVVTGAVLTEGCSSFADFFGVLTFLVFIVTDVLMEGEGGLEPALALDGILGCEGHGDREVSFPLTNFRLWHTKKKWLGDSHFVLQICVPFFSSHELALQGEIFSPKEHGSGPFPSPTLPFGLIQCAGWVCFSCPPADATAPRKTYQQISVFWKHLER